MKITKSITLTAETRIDEQVVMRHNATINSANPDDITLSHPVLRKTDYRDHRTECMTDYQEFEDMAFAVQAEMLADKNVTAEE